MPSHLDLLQKLNDKTLVMIIGPSAVGKSTIMQQIEQLDPRFSYVKSFTTRVRRENESTPYRHLSSAKAQQLIDSGEAITHVTFPTTGEIYGTTIDSYPGEFCLLDTMVNSVSMYRSLPFKNVAAISLTAPVNAWQEQFLSRYPTKSSEGAKRLAEAKLSIDWSLNQHDSHIWLVNDSNPPIVAKRALDIITGGDDGHGDDGTRHARDILTLIDKGVW